MESFSKTGSLQQNQTWLDGKESRGSRPEMAVKKMVTRIPGPPRNLFLSEIYLFSDLDEGISTICATGSNG